MNYKTIDWKAIARYLGPRKLTKTQRAKLKAQFRRAFKAGRMVAGTTYLGETSKDLLIGCALGQAGEIGIPITYPANCVVATINNYACTEDGDIPASSVIEKIPRAGGGARYGKRLKRIAPLLKLVDLL